MFIAGSILEPARRSEERNSNVVVFARIPLLRTTRQTFCALKTINISPAGVESTCPEPTIWNVLITMKQV